MKELDRLVLLQITDKNCAIGSVVDAFTISSGDQNCSMSGNREVWAKVEIWRIGVVEEQQPAFCLSIQVCNRLLPGHFAVFWA
ncbi:hypothetical protein PIIN_10695 [Serendipita indica DSM 11827]|uniref:Uncharacterized protein n=1 Tax=Serendipita indica (strain DSM 11827) TaxID=1109443 RepID=G4TZG4_SERID|nr:hypothetical protein PIIN_10695 [Serendipita indica DSM 11827]